MAYNHITTFEQGSMGGAYIARAGDTLQSIAAGMWGDASLWWKIAEANGLSGQSTLTEGQSLLIPVGVQRNENNAQTLSRVTHTGFAALPKGRRLAKTRIQHPSIHAFFPRIP